MPQKLRHVYHNDYRYVMMDHDEDGNWRCHGVSLQCETA